jgi:hypothetical protein
MIRFLPLLFIVNLFLATQNLQAQNYEWAYTSGLSIQSNPSLIKVDDNGNIYTASHNGNAFFLDNITVAKIEKRSPTQQLLWQINVAGNFYFADLDFLGSKIMVTGFFKGSVTLNGIALSSPADYAGFMFECNDDGTINWAKKLDPYNSRFKPSSIFISDKKYVYLTAGLFIGNARCAFYKLDTLGNILKTELPVRTDNATYSHVIADTSGNVYLTGTCGNNAQFDTILPNLTQSYQNFFVKYDSNFNAKYLITSNYITFDDENKLYSNGDHYFWAFHNINVNSNTDTVKILKISPNGQIVNSVNTPMVSNNSGVYGFAMNKLCTSSVYTNSNFLKLYVYKYDNDFNVIWKDTLQTNFTNGPKSMHIFCQAADFYLTNKYARPTLDFNGITITNPSTSDVFVAKWKTGTVLPLKWINFSALKNNGKIYLTWIVDRDDNGAKFEVEKSLNGINFLAIGNVQYWSNNPANTYGFIDEANNNQSIYYRIKQLDKEGKYVYSKIILVRNEHSVKFEFSPNPVTENLNISIVCSKIQNASISIINTAGSIVKQKQVTLLRGTNYFTFDLFNIVSGNYFIKITSDEISEFGKFQKR